MSSCDFHEARPAVARIEGRLLCWACERRWYDTGHFYGHKAEATKPPDPQNKELLP